MGKAWGLWPEAWWVGVCYLPAGVVGVFGQLAVEGLQEHPVCDLPHIHAGLVQHRENTLVLLLHKVHDDLVIKVVNLRERESEGERQR